MSQRNTAAAEVKKGKPAVKNPAKSKNEKTKKKGAGAKAFLTFIIILLLAITGFETYILFGGDNFQATYAVITQGRSYLDIADEEMLRQRQNLANQQTDIDQQRADLLTAMNAIDKEQKNIDRQKAELDARQADLDAQEQALIAPQKTQQDAIDMFATMDDAIAARTLMEFSDMNQALNILRGLKATKAGSIFAAMSAIDPSTASRFVEQYANAD